MKKAIIGLSLAAAASLAWASCSTHTYFANGKTIICTTCCTGNNCTTNCF